jgi:hypothetical protein
MKKEITYFDTTEKLLQNLLNCVEKDIDIHFIREALKTIITVSKTQNSIIGNLVQLNDEDVVFVKNDNPIIKGMIVWVRSKKKFAQINKIDTETETYTLNILGTDNILTVSRNQFNFF